MTRITIGLVEHLVYSVNYKELEPYTLTIIKPDIQDFFNYLFFNCFTSSRNSLIASTNNATILPYATDLY